MEYLYHGSDAAGIREFEPRSTLHGTQQKGVYLTDSIPYALLYIWNSAKHGGADKHVTAWIENGMVHYEEQFPDQLKTFYEGASGYLYAAEKPSGAAELEQRPGLFFCPGSVPVASCTSIADVYKALLEYERAGRVVVRRFEEQSAERQWELTELIAEAIVRSGWFEENEMQRRFMQRYFPASWRMAEAGKIPSEQSSDGKEDIIET